MVEFFKIFTKEPVTPTPIITPDEPNVADQFSFLRFGTNLPDLYALIQQVLNTLILITIITAVIYLILNGLKFVTSGGDQAKAAEAQKGITYAIIGIIIAVSSSLLVQFVLSKLDVNLVTF